MNIVPQERVELGTGVQSAVSIPGLWSVFLAIDFRGTGNSALYRSYGWSGQEADAVWAIGGKSGMTLPPIASSDAMYMDIDVDPCTMPPNILAQVFRIRVNGHLVGGVRIGGRSTVRCRVAPEILGDGEPIEIGFEHPCFVRMDMAGRHKDDRRLALRFRAMTIYSGAMAPLLATRLARAVKGDLLELRAEHGETFRVTEPGKDHRFYEFASDNPAADFLREGWYKDSTGSIFSSAVTCRIELPVPAEKSPHRLRINLVPLTLRDLMPRQSITVTLQDCVIGQFRLSSDTVLSLPLPMELVEGFPTLKLTFVVPLGVSMADFPGDGERRLGFLLERIDIEPVPAHLADIVDMRGDDADAFSPIAASARFLDTPLGDMPDAVEQALGIKLDVILRQFESMGDNCAFGLAQRKGGIEVLGLLRFANTPLKTLINGMNDGEFQAAVDPAEMIVRVHDEGDPREYMLWLDRYGVRWHTQIRENEADAESVYQQQTVKVGYLRRKFVEGIRAGRKIYTLARVDPIKINKVMPAWGESWKYEVLRENLRAAEVLPIFLQLNRHAKNTLLYFVTGGRYRRRSGTVEMLAPGLLVGHIDVPTILEDVNIRDNAEDWLRMIVNARILEHSANSAFRGAENIVGRLAERDRAAAEVVPLASRRPAADPVVSVPPVVEPGSAESVAKSVPPIPESGPSVAESGPESCPPVPESDPPVPELESPRDVVLRFESLGENCEFGLLQRRCDAEPLGLFRLASAPYDKLLRALTQNFEGLGDPDKIEIQVSDNGKEYLVLDRQYGFLTHAWVLVGEKTPEEVLNREIRRIPFLLRKLLEDLKRGEKIFVHHSMQPLDVAQAKRLSTALRRFGPNILLWVELADDEHEAGTVERIRPGLLKGYIDRFAPGEDAHDFSVESWMPILRGALAKSRE
jgi:hypothetical protein